MSGKQHTKENAQRKRSRDDSETHARALRARILHDRQDSLRRRLNAAHQRRAPYPLERLVPRGEEWKHNDPRYSDCDRSNADAHLRAIMLGNSVTLQVAEGALTMGQWQRVLMAELDGPRERVLVLQVLATG